MTDFDPWTAELSDALAAQKAFEQSQTYGQRDDYRQQPFHQWFVARDVDKLQLEIEKNDECVGHTILSAILMCAKYDLVIPRWLSDVYESLFQRLSEATKNSWDEVLGPPFQKGTHVKNLRAKRLRDATIIRYFLETLTKDPGVSINDELFRDIGKKEGVKKSKGVVAQVYIENKDLLSKYKL